MTPPNTTTPATATDGGANGDMTVGVILAGGKSTRMGKDKAALCLHGESLLLRTRATMLAAGCAQVVLSGPRRADWPLQYDVIPDFCANAGPVAGIVSALHWAAERAVQPVSSLLFVAVDTPMLTAPLLSQMISTASAHEVDGCMIADSPLPLLLQLNAIVFRHSRIARVELLSGSSWPVKRLIQYLNLCVIPAMPEIESQLLNVNTPADWQGVRHELENCP